MSARLLEGSATLIDGVNQGAFSIGALKGCVGSSVSGEVRLNAGKSIGREKDSSAVSKMFAVNGGGVVSSEVASNAEGNGGFISDSNGLVKASPPSVSGSSGGSNVVSKAGGLVSDANGFLKMSTASGGSIGGNSDSLRPVASQDGSD